SARRSRVTKDSPISRRAAWAITTTQQTTSTVASQKGKKPLRGPSVPHPMPRRMASAPTSPPRRSSTDAVTMSATRMLFFEQAALRHQVLMELVVLLDPLRVLGAGGPRGLERALLEVLLPVGRVDHLLQEGLVPLHRVLGHVGRAEDPAEHQVLDVGAEGLLHGGDVLPAVDGDARAVEHREGPHPARLPVAPPPGGGVPGWGGLRAPAVSG